MEFDFDVMDGGSGPLKALETALDKLDKTLQHVDQHLDHFDKETKHTGASATEGAVGVKGFFEAMLGAEAAEQAADVIKELAEHVLELGERLLETGTEMADFRNDALLSIGAITGNDAAAGDFLETLEYMSKGTKDTGEQMFASFQRMGAFTKQFGKKATEDVLAGIADVKVAFGQGAGDAVLHAIQSSQAMGKFDERALRGLKESGVATPERLIQVLAAQHHTSAARIDALLKAGKISAAEGTNAILGLIRQDLDKGGAVGSLSKLEASGNVGAQVKNFRDHIKELFEKVDTKPLTDALAKLGALFDPNTERGKKLEAIINRIFKALGDVVSWVTEGDRLGEIFDKIGKYAEMAWPVVKGLGVAFGLLGVAVGVAMIPVIAIGAAFYGVSTAVLYALGSLGKIWDWLKGLPAIAVKAGGEFVDGLVQGITAGISRAEAAVKNLGKSIVDSAKDVLKIHSPSRVMFELGSYTAEGMELGLKARLPQVRSSMTDVMLPTVKYGGPAAAHAAIEPPQIAVPTSAVGGARHFQGGDISVTVNVDGAHAGAASDPHQLAELVVQRAREELQPMVRAEIVRALEDAAIAN